MWLIVLALVVLGLASFGYKRAHDNVNAKANDLRRAGDDKPAQIKNVGGTRGLNF